MIQAPVDLAPRGSREAKTTDSSFSCPQGASLLLPPAGPRPTGTSTDRHLGQEVDHTGNGVHNREMFMRIFDASMAMVEMHDPWGCVFIGLRPPPAGPA